MGGRIIHYCKCGEEIFGLDTLCPACFEAEMHDDQCEYASEACGCESRAALRSELDAALQREAGVRELNADMFEAIQNVADSSVETNKRWIALRDEWSVRLMRGEEGFCKHGQDKNSCVYCHYEDTVDRATEER
jgi:hypothetical protein